MIRSTLVLTVLVLVLPAVASADGEAWHLRIGAAWVDPSVDFTDVDSDGDRVVVSDDGEIGLTLAIERQFSRRLGIELGVVFAEPRLILDVDLTGGVQASTAASVGFTAITAGLNVHLTPDKALDVYLAPLLVYTSYDDLAFRFIADGQVLAADFSSDDDYAVGLQIGADIPFGDRPWSVNLAAKYLDTSLSVIDAEGVFTELAFDPLILVAGFGYRF